ncbi:MAG: STAS domain-containing protein [Actinomycetota bacterium]
MKEAALHIRTGSIDDGVCLSLAGELDIATADSVKAALEGMQAASPGVLLIDLRGLVFMDSTGLQVVLQAARRAETHGGRLVLVRGRRPVQRVFELAQLESRLAFVDDPGEVTA